MKFGQSEKNSVFINIIGVSLNLPENKQREIFSKAFTISIKLIK